MNRRKNEYRNRLGCIDDHWHYLWERQIVKKNQEYYHSVSVFGNCFINFRMDWNIEVINETTTRR